jgi:hypothetical protein
MNEFSTSNKRRKSSAVRDRKRPFDVSALQDWIDSQEFHVNANIHVNGRSFSGAYVTVDFGSPLTPFSMNDDQNAEFSDHLRKLAREVAGKQITIRIGYDQSNGIYWASAG